MSRITKVAVITTHPIQYNAPLFKLLNSIKPGFTIKVFYTWSQAKEKIFDKDFGIALDWDIPLLEGYDYTFVDNIAKVPGSHHFKGIVNPSLNKEIEEWKADALLVFGWSFSSHLGAIRYFHHKIPVVFRGDSTLIDEPSGFSTAKIIRRLFLRWVYSYVDHALYVGTANKKYFLTHGLKSKQLSFAPHAIDNNRFAGNSPKFDDRAKNWRSSLGIGQSEVVFLFAGKLTLKKDPELLIKAFLALNHPDATLVILGNGELETSLKMRYTSFHKIIFIDFQNQSVMPVVYRLGDVFVLPSKGPGETWGLAINEAMACGRAVIASDKCGCSYDLIRNGENGYVFESGNQESLQNCLTKSISKFKEQGKKSRDIISEWSYSKTVKQLQVLFGKILVDATN